MAYGSISYIWQEAKAAAKMAGSVISGNNHRNQSA